MQMDLTGLSARLLAELTGVSLKTATRWKRANHLPTVAQELATIKASADLGHLAKPWSGFHLTHDLLWTPEGDKVTPGDIRAIQYRLQQLRDIERESRQPRQFVLL